MKSLVKLGHWAQRILKGSLVFYNHNGQTLAGGCTFFIAMSFCPLLLLIISVNALISGNPDVAQQEIMRGLKSNFPHLAPWIYQSISSIVQNQVKGTYGNWVNFLLLFWSTVGLFSTLSFGLESISGEAKPKRFFYSFIVEDFKSGIIVLTLGVHFLALMALTPGFFLYNHMTQATPTLAPALELLGKFNIGSIVLSLVYFTCFYKFSTPLKVSFKDSFIGASSFVGLFILGKSFYWFYLKFMREELIQNFGNFYTLIVAVSWVYFLMWSLLMSASIAYADHHETKGIGKLFSFKKRDSLSKAS